MFLKRCEMVGFKTFADKIDMEFGPGITAIVGPNGSGKSNITDALRFCLGEGSVRTLRGNRMEEMVFAGSRDRQPAGMAEVTITFDNADGYFPLEYSDIAITRKLFRGGDNQYFINKTPCRLKDIHQMLAGTGLGQGSICMLGTREMQMVLSPDAQDRKLVLEEASGVMKYKMRKREAARKLDQVKENLTRLHDILREVRSGLSTAETQVERYRRYKKYEERLRKLEVGLAAQEMDLMQQSLVDVVNRGKAAGERAQVTGERMGALEESIRERREEMGRLEDELQQAAESRRQASVELERARNEIALCDEREKNLEKERERIQLRLEKIKEQDGELGLTIEEGKKDLGRASAAVAEREVEVRAQDEALQAVEAHSIEKSPEYQAAVAEQNRVAQERATLNARSEAIEERARRADGRAASLDEQATRAQDEGSRHGSNHEEKASQAAQLHADIMAIEGSIGELKSRRAEIEAELESTSREFEKIEDAYHQRSSRLGALMEIEDGYAGFSEGVRYLLKRPDHEKIPGVIGTVAECLVPQQKHARAIEAALGGHAQDVLVEEKRHAKSCIELLKRERAGKVTFWPLDLERPMQRKPDACTAKGVVGWAPDLVRFDHKYEGVVMALLGRTVVVENLDVATELYEDLVRKRAFIPLLVTLDGDVLAPGGSMSGGAQRNNKAGPVQRRAELEALEREVDDLRRRFIKIKDQRRKRDEELRAMRVQGDELRTEAQKLAQRLVELERVASVAQSRAESVASEVARLRGEAAAAREEADAARGELSAVRAALGAVNEAERAVAERLAEFALQREDQAIERNIAAKILEELREGRAEAMRVEAEVAQRLRFLTERRAELAREAVELESEVSGQGGLAGKLMRQRERASDDLARYSELDLRSAERCEQLSRSRTSLGATLETQESEFKEVSRSHEEDRAELHACEVERAKYQTSYDEHRQRMEELEVSRDELLAARDEELDREAAHVEVVKLRNYLKNFGNVNLGAVEDYENLRQRHDEMSHQIQDLEDASAGLLEVMNEMDAVSVKQFAETFEKVRRNFGDIFEELFRGGQASLVLTDKENLLETGVDILAQPPGKRQQNLSLLSSGEKALTAIAFLLAILKSRPSPFVVLDELDAPLDDTNVERVARKFLEFSENTQFITITHNRKTMEFARVLYGVTMVEPGVSRLVAVTLEEARREMVAAQPAVA